MAALRKLDRLFTSLKGIDEYTKTINDTTSYNAINTHVKKLDEIRRDASETLDNSTSISATDIATYWSQIEESHGTLMAILLDERDHRQNPERQPTVNDLEGSITAVLNSQKSFFDQFSSTTVNDRTTHNNSNNHDVKVPRLTIHPFHGGDDDYKKWPPFYNMFRVSVHENDNISTVHKFQLLNSFLKGEAFDLISHLLVTDENYEIAWNKLCSRYNKKRNIANSYIKQFLNLPQINSVNNKNLRHFADVSDEMLRGLDALGNSFESRDPWLIFILLSKLDDDTNSKWADISSDNDQDKSISDFILFLNKRCDAIEACQLHSKSISSKSKGATKSFVTSSFTNKSSNKCPHCNDNHPLYKCFKFISYNCDERRSLVSTLNLCFNCLKPNHTTLKCFSNAVCQICKRKHHTLLHANANNSSHTTSNQIQPSAHISIHSEQSDTPVYQLSQLNSLQSNQLSSNSQSSYSPHLLQSHSQLSSQQSNSSQPSYSPQFSQSNSQLSNKSQPCTHNTQTQNSISQQSSTQNFLLQGNGQSLLPTVQAYARDTSGHFHIVRALLDSASMCSFVTESCVQKLELRRSHACLSVTSLSCQKAGTTRGQVEIELFPIHYTGTPITLDALIMNKITSKLPLSDIDISSWSAIKPLTLADATFNHPNKIDILIGVKHFYKIQSPEPIIDVSQDIIAQNTKFGWVLAGQTVLNERTMSLCTVSEDKCDNFHDILQNFWKLEEVPACKTHSPEEIAIENHYVSNTVEMADGKYSVKLPFNTNVCNLGESKPTALRRFYSIEAKFKRDPQFKLNYVKFMDEYLSMGHMEEVSHAVKTNESFYLPHHAVIKKESSTTKTRVVFDGSCKTSSGVSLNECLMSGPNIQKKLVTILLNFRTYNIAFASDVEKMYRQIWVSSSDRDYQRILWRYEPSEPLKTYRLKTVTYGTTAAPFLAIRSLMKIATDSSNLTVDAKRRIQEDFYVDDLLSGSQTLEHAIQMKEQITSALQQHGMPLRKWASNSIDFMHTVPSDYVQTQSSIEFHDENILAAVKTLGLNWNPSTDDFFFNVHISENLCTTKRQISSLAAKIFDPLGWLTPATVVIKIFLQALWINKLDWDDEVSENILAEWNKIYSSLSILSNVRVPRCLNLYFGDQKNVVQIHGFSDASEVAYGAAVYLRIVRNDEILCVNLVAAKSKVAPIKQISLARLELCGALLLTDLINWVFETLKCEAKIYAWTDSSIVLAWLSNIPRKWATFVANRTSKILESLPRHHWHHVKSEFNPADLASRGLLSSELSTSSMWWHGPSWLMSCEREWPVSAISDEIPESILEIKHNTKINLHTNIETNIFNKLFIKFASLHKILKSICIFNRFLQYIRGIKQQPGFITAKEMQKSEVLCIKWAQHEAFAAEIKCLASLKSRNKSAQTGDDDNISNGTISCRTTLRNLTPFLDDNNVLRVGGRLDYADIPYSTKHPIILPRNHILSKRLVEEYHQKYLHTGTSTMMGIIRQKFWIVGLRNMVKNVSRGCVRCTRIKAKTSTQLMGNLPKARLTPTRTFVHTGIDFAGPLQIRATTGRGRVQVTKGYIAIFICFTSRAIHLELVSNMTTEAFIASLKRFSSRRGIPAVIHCDNGTNFVGSEKELRRAMHKFINLYDKGIIDFATEHEIEFQFNPPSGPHFGALWESNIKSVKTHLKRTTKDALLTFEEMATLLTQIEAILNSRPLTPITDDINDLNFLTPSHFLIGTNITAIPEPNYEHLKETYLSRWQNIQKRIQGFWKIWSANYITSLQERSKWQTEQRNLQLGDLVLIKDDGLPPSRWAMGRVLSLKPGHDGLVRVVKLKTQTGELDRPVVKLVKLPME